MAYFMAMKNEDSNPDQSTATDASRNRPLRPLYARLWRDWVARHRAILFQALALMAVVSASAAAYPALIQKVFDGLGAASTELLYTIPPLIIAITLVKGGAMYLQVRQVNILALTVTRELQKAMAAHLIRADLALVAASPGGEFVSRLLNDVQLVREAVIRLANNLVRDVLTIAAMIAMLVWFDWLLTLVVLVVYPVAMKPIVDIGRRQRKQAAALQAELGDATSILTEVMQGSRMIRAYGLEAHQADRAASVFDILFRRVLRLTLGKARIDPILEVLGGVAVAGVIAVAGWRVANGDMRVGDVAGFITALLMMVQPVRGLGTLNAVVQEAASALERVFALLDTHPKIASPKTPKKLVKPKGKIRFKGVGFSYGGEPVLRDIGFEASPGRMVALVGPSGAGKTTVVNLLPRFYDCTKGTVSLDGHPVQSLDLASLRGAMALVSQDSVLFNDTIANNIRLGRLDATDDEVEAAARAAAAHDFILEQSWGYGTMVGEGGSRLSGGQRQRIAIARAILKDAPVLLLDEATSALDSSSEQQIQSALERLMKGRTTLVVAHRLATVRKADLILVMDGGRIVERGTHGKLVKAKGLYARLSALQHFGD